jgi:hypothetical protein
MRRRGSLVVTSHHRVGDVLVDGGLVLPTRPPRRGPCSCACPRHTAMLGTSRCPRGVKNTNNRDSIGTMTCTHRDPNWKNTKIKNSLSRRGCTPLVLWGTLCCGSARRICSPREPLSPPWRPRTARPGLGRIAPSIQRPDGPIPGEVR